jgi:MacB-like periplasmic core domain/FtsX-like permease family
MAAVWVRAAAELRRRWRATVLLAVLVGLTGGVVLAAAAGARRTDSAVDRFLAYNRPLDVHVWGERLDLRAVERLPQVADFEMGAFLGLTPSTSSGAPDPEALGNVAPLLGVRGSMGVTSDRYLLVAGRRPDPGQPLEVVVNEKLAARRRIGPGGTLRLWAYTPRQAERPDVGRPGEAFLPRGPALDLTVTAVGRWPQDLQPGTVDEDVVYLGTEAAYLTPAFWRTYRDRVGVVGGSADETFRLRGGPRDLEAFTSAVRRLRGGRDAVIQVGSDAGNAAREAEQAIHVQAVALLVFAALTAVAAVLVVGQGIARQVQLDADERQTLAALGMTAGQVAGVVMARAVLVGVGGALLAVTIAVLASPLTPIGLARQAEIDPGWSVDAPVLAMGAVSVLAAVLARAGLAAWWLLRPGTAAAGDRGSALQPSMPAERLARAGVAPSAVTGIRQALEPRRRGAAVPPRTALAGIVVAVAAVTAGLSFAASLDRLVRSPALQGWNWDVVVGNYHDEQDIISKGSLLARNPLISGYSALAAAPRSILVDGVETSAVAVEPVRGAVLPRILRGREARSAGELALGGVTLRRIGRRVGDTIEVRGTGEPRRMLVVGEAMAPGNHPELTAGGAVLTLDGLRALVPEAFANQFLVRYVSGADEAAAVASLRRDFGRTVLREWTPSEIYNLGRVRALPVVLAAMLAVLGVGTLGHLLVTSVRRRSRDLAVLKAIGFVRGQVSATVAWQATTLSAVALLVGLPLGVAAGRWAWLLVNRGLGSPAGPVTPTLAVLVVIPATVLVANLVAALPARAAAATRPAVVLRSE